MKLLLSKINAIRVRSLSTPSLKPPPEFIPIFKQYATFHPKLPQPVTECVIQLAKTYKPKGQIDVLKWFWYGQYACILQQPTLFFIQNNALTSKEYEKLTLDLRTLGLGSLMLKTALFRACVRQWVPMQSQELEHLLRGRLFMVFSMDPKKNALEWVKPLNALLKEKKRRTTVMAVKMDDTVLTTEHFSHIVDLPSKDMLLAQLIGVLESPSMSLVSTLGQPFQQISMNLSQLESQIKEKQS